MWQLFKFTVLITISSYTLGSNPEFDSDEEPDDEQPIHFSLMHGIPRVKRSEAQKLRYEILKSYEFEIRNDADELLKTLIIPSIERWTKHLLPMHPVKENLLVKRQCTGNSLMWYGESDGLQQEYCMRGCSQETKCYTTTIPDMYLSPCREVENGRPVIRDNAGVGLPSTDFLLVVDASNDEQCNKGTLAYAVTCELDPVSGRPMVSYFNICPNFIAEDRHNPTRLADVVTHELGHALGFVLKTFAFMTDSNGQPRTPRDPDTRLPTLGKLSANTYKPSDTTLGDYSETYVGAIAKKVRKVKVLKTPKLVEVARKYTGCADLDFVHLESQTGSSLIAAHFEKRIYNGDIMVASPTLNMGISDLILAFFEDSGWYHVNYDGSMNLTWGRGLGCDFVYKSCYEYSKLHPNNGPWCFELTSRCPVRDYPYVLPVENQYFTSIYGVSDFDVQLYGGTDKLMDYCPFIEGSR